jgi:hypothetical protein
MEKTTMIISVLAAVSLIAQLELPRIEAKNAKQWKAERERVLLAFTREVYGRAPAKPVKQGFELMERSEDALGGKGIRKQVKVWFEGPAGKRDAFELLVYLPKSAKKVPVFLGMNFGGNQCVTAEEAIHETKQWTRPKTDLKRGACASRWEVEYLLSRGYGVATYYYGDLDPDFDDGFANGVHAVFGKPAADEWGSIAAWAWGASRAMDYLAQDPQVDAKRVALHGHSRLGKAALWAGALDERFAMVVSNNSGEGGAALARRKTGERTQDLNRSFPHWFAGNFKKYSGKEESLPVDSHQLLALIAPRPLYVGSASEDLWADPEGEYEACVAVSPLYRALGHAGLESGGMPKPGERRNAGRVGYHLREGKHDITKWDWEGYLDFADRWMR